jgi:hypothetical protein
MRSGPTATAASILVVVLFSAGCGDEQSTAAESAHLRTGDVSRTEARRCRRVLGDFLDATESLQNSVAVGVSYESYLTGVNHVRASYAETEADNVPLLCLVWVAGPAERALNAYIDAANEWGECLADSSCNAESIEPELQRRWRRAADLIASAQNGVRRS